AFGSVNAARELAGVGVLRRRWTREAVVAAVRERGARPIADVLSYACIRYFGSTRAAREAAGMRPLRTRWSRDRVVAALRESRSPLPATLMWACRSYFGSVAAARNASAQTHHTVTANVAEGALRPRSKM